MDGLNRLICSSKVSDLRPIGTPKQRLYSKNQSLLSKDGVAKSFAQPIENPNGETIDWYTEENGKITKYEDLDIENQENLKNQFKELIEKIDSLKNNLAYKDEDKEQNLILNNYVKIPDINSIFLVGNKIVLVNWSYEKRNKAERTFDISEFLENQNKQEETNIETDDPNVNELSNRQIEEPSKNETENFEEKIPVAESTETQEQDPKKENTGLEKKYTFSRLALWLAIITGMLILLLFLLLKDACGVKGMGFLDFCSNSEIKVSKLKKEISILNEKKYNNNIKLARMLDCQKKEDKI